MRERLFRDYYDEHFEIRMPADYAEAEPAARAIGRAADAAEEQEARESLSAPRSSILVEGGPGDQERRRS